MVVVVVGAAVVVVVPPAQLPILVSVPPPASIAPYDTAAQKIKLLPLPIERAV
jgi:hypothetical protein